MVLQHLRSFGWTLCFAAFLSACSSPVQAAEKTKVEDESPSAVMPEDPKSKSYLRRAETAVKDKDWNQALTLLDKIVAECGDSLVMYRRNTLESLNIDADTVQFHWWTYISTRELVARMKSGLPDSAVKLTEVTAGPQAKSLLITGIETGDAELLVTLTENYPGTDSADNALYVLGEWNLLKEDYGSAVACFRKILTKYKDTTDLDMNSIRWRLCQTLELAGDAKGAAAELATLVQGGQYPATARGGQLEAIATAWLAKLKGQTQTSGTAGTISSSAATMMGGEAHNNYIKDVPPMGDRMLTMEYDLAFVEQVHKSEIAERDAAANIYPVVRDETVFLTDGRRIRAYNLINPEPKRPYWAQPSREDRRPLDPNKIEHCRTLTVSDNMVYAVMGQSTDVSVAFQWNQGPQYQIEKTHLEGYERPTGHPVMYGRIKWSTYKADDMVNSEADKKFLDQFHFPAAPVYVDGILYCSGITLDDEHSCYALAFSADTGKLRWRHKLCSGTILAGINRAIDLGSQVAVSAGKVYVQTPMGTVACLEAISGSVKWQTAWQQTIDMQKLNQFNGQTRFPDEVPYPQPPIVFKDRVMIMPQDCHWMIAFDADTGEPKWIRDRREGGVDLHYLYGIATTEATVRRKGVVYKEQVGILIGAGKKLIAYNVSNGKAVWEIDLSPYERAVGIGVVTENWVLVPTRTHLVPVRVTDGSIPRDDELDAAWHPYKWESPKLQAGHVLVNNGVIITAGPNAFSVYYIKSERQKQLLAKMQAEGESPELWMQIADLDDRTHEYDKALETLAKAHTLAATWAAMPANDPKAGNGKMALEESGRRIALINFKAGMQSLLPIQGDDEKINGGAKEGLLPAAERSRLATAALARFDLAGAAVLALAAPPADLGAQATWGRARALETLAANDKKAANAIAAFQELLSKYGEVTYAFYNDGKTETTGKAYGREKIQQLIEKYGRDQYAAIEAAAVKVYNEEAAKKPGERNLERLRTMLEAYPNANARGDALLLSAEVAEQEKGPR
ncbi:MAG TPA: PQQ-binding-like beta-propeller repeat protein, partial [Planctomycetota bacterium]|nr:PQQ-binding-like beta-propeller repeat protein [Planctomycetota bacterium]